MYEHDGDIKMSFTPPRETRVVFDKIYDVVTAAIDDPAVHYVIGCMAWFSNKRVIKSLSRKEGCCIITMLDGVCKNPAYTALYSKLPVISPYGSLRVVSSQVANGYLMHHKFIIGLDAQKRPRWVINGSCNFSETSAKNRENIVVHYERHVASAFITEFDFLLSASIPWAPPGHVFIQNEIPRSVVASPLSVQFF